MNETRAWLSQYLRMCDNIYLMKEGRVMEAGTHEELMESGSYYANIVHTYYRRPSGIIIIIIDSYWCSSAVERRSLTGELSLVCTGPAADG